MPIKMKILMDKFYEFNVESRKEGNFSAMEIYSLAESYANNCHGMSDEETTDYVTTSLQYLLNKVDTVEARQAVNIALDAAK